MAELNIERKERNVWPWIIAGLLVAALLLWFLTRGNDQGTEGAAAPGATGTAPGGSASVGGGPLHDRLASARLALVLERAA